MMKDIRLTSLEHFLSASLTACGLPEQDVCSAADIFMRATLRGVGHHDIYDLPSRLEDLLQGKINPKPRYKKLASFNALESYDADKGLGEVVCCFAMDRAEILADKHGIGLCAIRNSNHFLAAAPYVEKSAEHGYISLLMCKGGMNMGIPDRKGNCMGALPLGFAFGTNGNFTPVFDACLAYASYGQLRDRVEKGQSIEPWWGSDADGVPTKDPAKVIAGTRMAIGGHKGYALAMLGEMITSVLTNGWMLDKPSADGDMNHWGHTAVAIKADALMSLDEFKKRTGSFIDQAETLSPGIHIPGQGSAESKKAILMKGTVPLREKLLSELNDYAERLRIARLE